MSECYIEVEDENAAVECDNCGWEGKWPQCEMIADIQERINAGCATPAGECPECGALAYLTKPPAYTAQFEANAFHAASKILRDLLAWENLMGGWDAKAWQDAKTFVRNHEAPATIAPSPAPADFSGDHAALLAIQELLDGVEWSADTLGEVAQIMIGAGYRIRDLNDVDRSAS